MEDEMVYTPNMVQREERANFYRGIRKKIGIGVLVAAALGGFGYLCHNIAEQNRKIYSPAQEQLDKANSLLASGKTNEAIYSARQGLDIVARLEQKTVPEGFSAPMFLERRLKRIAEQ